MGSTWRDRFEFADIQPDPEPDEGPGVTRDGVGWVAYLRLEDPPGLAPITTVGRFATVEAAQLATDEVWAAR